MTTSDDQLSRWSKKKLQSSSQSQTLTKKMSQSLFGGLLPVWSMTAFWIPEKPLHLRSMLSTWMRCTKTATPAAGIAQQTGPNSSSWQHSVQPTLHKLNKLGSSVLSPSVLPHPSFSPDLSPTNYHVFKHLNNFLQGITLPQPAGGRRCFLRVHWIPKHGFVCYRNKQTYFSLTKTCW